jgi:membrane protease YdiL (CAAX protease family)
MANAPLATAPPGAGTTFFFVVTLGTTWALGLPAVLARYGVLAGPPERYLPFIALGGFAPLAVAVLASYREAGRPGMRALFRPEPPPRPGARWLVVAILLFAAIHLAGMGVYRALGGAVPQWLFPPGNPEQLAAMVIFPLAEEPGWRGFALPRLQARVGPLRASLIVGVLWAAWHAMMFVLQGLTPLLFAVAVVNIVAGSFVFTWLYNRSGGSLLVAVVAHVGVHLDNPTHALPGHPAPFVVFTVAVVVAAVVLVVADRQAWRGSPPAAGA